MTINLKNNILILTKEKMKDMKTKIFLQKQKGSDIMRFYYGKQDFCNLSRAQENSILLTNGLGGYAGMTSACSVNRCDQGILVAAVRSPNERIGMVHRVREVLETEKKEYFISTQEFADKTAPEEGYRYLNSFRYEDIPVWTYQLEGVFLKRKLCTAWGRNSSALCYEIKNTTDRDCTIRIEPFLKFAPKENALQGRKDFSYESGMISDGTYTMYLHTDGDVKKSSPQWQKLSYAEDAKDGRPEEGYCCCCCQIVRTIPAGAAEKLEIVFSMDQEILNAREMEQEWKAHRLEVEKCCTLSDPIARQLVLAADDYIVRRDSTKGKTILAGYPLFSDWGRDTMIALSGCCLTTGRFEDAKSILRTFMAYEKDGLVPNLFPEGESKPMYNTVDAALLFIDCVWQYVMRTDDWKFVEEAWPVMEHVVACYRKGTHHKIGMDKDGLIYAGGGMDQVTWMDVCVNGILPTPRHGKPVEINAYWYNALCIMDRLAKETGHDSRDYGLLAWQVKESFVAKFYIKEKGYLRDVISGTKADEQLRCNQIWAVSMPFTMLTSEMEKQIVDKVERYLYTPCGLRTLSPKDPEYHPYYGGPQVERDMAYHQGTTWVFPMGAYYLAKLKVMGYTEEAVMLVREQLEALEPMLHQGCLGQLPEIYDGEFPTEGKGCFAQAWSVGEMLRVFEAIEKTGKK